MPVTRRFLITPSLTRLIRKEYGSERVTEGHFAPQSERQSYVRIESGGSYLVLTSADAGAEEDRTDLPSLHAEALLEVCPGTVIIERSRVPFPDLDVFVDRFVTPGLLDLVDVEFQTEAQAAAFRPPVWFGEEVTSNETCTNRAIALSGLPREADTPLSNAALDAMLDLIEGQSSGASSDLGERQEGVAEEDSTFDMLRRLAVVVPADASAQPSEPVATPTAEKTAEVAELKPRRPVLQTAPAREQTSDERLAVVIDGLSEALSQSVPQNDSHTDSDLRAQPGWRWSIR
jgi:CYTH domain-containing protein